MNIVYTFILSFIHMNIFIILISFYMYYIVNIKDNKLKWKLQKLH